MSQKETLCTQGLEYIKSRMDHPFWELIELCRSLGHADSPRTTSNTEYSENKEKSGGGRTVGGAMRSTLAANLPHA